MIGSLPVMFFIAGSIVPVAVTRSFVCLYTGSLQVQRTRVFGLWTTTEYRASPIEARLLALGKPVEHSWVRMSTTELYTTTRIMGDSFPPRKAVDSQLHWDIASLSEDQFLSTLDWLRTATDEQVDDLARNPGPRGIAVPGG